MSVNMPVLLPFHHRTTQYTSLSVDSQTLDSVDTLSLQQTKKPPMYKIIMLNDDFTPMDFVVYVIESIFQKEKEEAIKIMYEIHNTGMGHCGTFTYEIAETKQNQVMQLSKKHQHPLQCVLEKE
ncbi:ATP-dependent Clp protease adapter protein ClpS (ClpS) (PDB:1LZW) [Commensalibacter communis]|uniref:ATP-dependent Clp protease adapter protein ClpS n=2 Tax=Commensalibacter communis TaxID=2972786 RepID=A0A9W4X702_9PROT|nr:ATP-dependent Clp protease adapter protein ClpS (ClpS) (PDB:1LZW) [Commensalibacter communis]CAI3934208.1 ATP-dependent Clp protease adapter protein ClpS (ClpS) (PDB:1LZW) [Commensalibacter communis]CAI3943844.1 ATP-dependent Clp protease adapter protein ClpS (ClpS) (PDB:1LZW) [Commensalibacter communis]CAI3945333.1 ATP-dependent Clp protease adapter protein ClpS (ClpS) (PDB:1LZW) [Commensalibacter communis]CAI3946205.1 ATP-dependent Clp protease adapter protein ClpS (ClpS) (PDB:1LZW) [Comme